MRGLACALILVGCLSAARAAPEVQLEEERPDQPPGKPARDDVFARSPGMRVGFGSYESIQVNVDEVGANIVGDAANEPSIAVNPLDPANMVIGFRQFDTNQSNWREAGWAYTFDGGQSWTFNWQSLELNAFRSDPVVDADASGTFFYQSLRGPGVFSVDVYRSTDGGISWSSVPAFGGDKNWMVVDRSGGPTDGTLYGIWSRLFSCCGDNVFTRSFDGGLTFDSPVPVETSPIAGTLAVGPGGEVYSAGFHGYPPNEGTFVATSTNASDPAVPPSFSAENVPLGGGPFTTTFPSPNPQGLLGQANVFVNPAPGPRRGEVYVLQSIEPNSEGFAPADPRDVVFTRRSAEYPEWSAPVRVNDDPPGNWNWMAAASVSPTGRIDAVWLDTRASGLYNLAQLFYAYSWDGGGSWSPNIAVTPTFNTSVGYPNQQKIGDYLTLVSGETGADVAFPGTFNNEQDVYYVRVFPDCDGNGVSDVTDLENPSVFDCNANHVPDLCENAPLCVGAGAISGGLRVERAGADLLLRWDPSCAAGDDYAVYEGTLGSYSSLAPRACSTGTATSRVLAPAEGNTFYLVVPTFGGREGSYGEISPGVERPPSQGVCHPQQIGSCAR